MKNPIRRNYDFAGAFVMLSGLLYLPVFLLESWNGRTQAFVILGLFFILLGWFLRGRRRWLAYIAYVLTLLALLVTFVAMGTSSIGAWWWVLVMLLQALSIFSLFKILWAPKGEFDK